MGYNKDHYSAGIKLHYYIMVYMAKIVRGCLFVITVLLVFTQCRKKEFDEYYGRPDNLEAPIFQQLEARKNFTQLLACIDKAGYKEPDIPLIN